MEQLNLLIEDYESPRRWRWLLTDDAGTVVNDFQVEIVDGPESQAFEGLGRYLRAHFDRNDPLRSEAGLVSWLGQWIGDQVLGPIGADLVARAPVEVAVGFSEPALELMFRPWELAVVAGQPLALQDVSLVMIPSPREQRTRKSPVGGRLRMLAVFSQPADQRQLILAEQSRALTKLVKNIRNRTGKAIELSVLQYNVSRTRLTSALEEYPGWDIVHFSGHGLVDGLLLENADGTTDLVPTEQAIKLLSPGRAQLKLLVLSSCNSAAAPPADTAAAGRMLPGLAEYAVSQLDCGVLAMRYPVDDEFSIDLMNELYSSLLDSGQPLTRALQLGLPKALSRGPGSAVPPLSAGIPALFGRRCLDLVLTPPESTQGLSPRDQRMAYFPDASEYFIGRPEIMTRGARLLLSEDTAGIAFTGAAGLGKSACAVELVHRYQDSFGALAAYCPQIAAGGSIHGALRKFALAMDQQLPGLQLSGEVDNVARLRNYLPRLTATMRERAILVLIDGIDGLLTSEGRWRDPSWGEVVAALLGARGASKLILTCRDPLRSRPAGLAAMELTPLSVPESVLLARRLPLLGSLIRGTSGFPVADAKLMLARALTSAAGNPAAICRQDDALAGKDPAQAGAEAGPVTPDTAYVRLIDRWTNRTA